MSCRSAFSRLFLTLLTPTFCFFLMGCGSSVEKAVEQTIEETHPIDPAGTLSIRNSQGSVRIYGSDVSDLKLKATKKAWSTSQLDGIAVRVVAKLGAISLETAFPPQKTWGFSNRLGSVDYEIKVPATIKIPRFEVGNGDVLIEGIRGEMHIDVVNGALVTRNCSGKAKLAVASGGLDLFYESLEERFFWVEARIISGNARAFFPVQASFRVKAETASGTITNHLANTGGRPQRPATKVNMALGSGGPEINIRATDGNIEIAPAKAE